MKKIALLLVLPVLVAWPGRLPGAEFTVMNTDDMGSGSLRQAIIDANGNGAADTITFDPTVFATETTIVPASQPPALSEGETTIDASGVGPVILAGSTDFSSPANFTGVRITSANNQIRGLEIERFSLGVEIDGSNGNVIKGCTIRNNSSHGVAINGSDNQIGTANELNLIAGNSGDGVRVEGGTGNRILSFAGSHGGGLGINLVGGTEDALGVTQNDEALDDADTGPNNLQNYPKLCAAAIDDEHNPTSLKVLGILESAPNQTYDIDFFLNIFAFRHESGHGPAGGFGIEDGYVGAGTVTTDSGGQALFSVILSFPSGFTGGNISTNGLTCTATDPNGNTSEFSKTIKLHADTDGDGLADHFGVMSFPGVDGQFVNNAFVDEKDVASDNYTDEHLGGSTFGSIVSRNGLDVSVYVDPEEAGAVLISAIGPSGNGPASITECGAGQSLDNGTCIRTACTGSFFTDVLTGTLRVFLRGGTVVTAAEGASVFVSEVGEEEVEVISDSSSTASITIETDGELVELSPGAMLTVPGSFGIEAGIDIKPGSFPNSINLGSGGGVAVAILSSIRFDATKVDPNSIRLASAEVRLRGNGTPFAAEEDVNGDGRPDLVVHVETEALELSETDTVAYVEAQLSNGTLVTGSDSVRVVP